MNKISQKQINAGAHAHAKEQLGEQFKTNPDAVKAIQEDFKAGVKWTIKTQNQK